MFLRVSKSVSSLPFRALTVLVNGGHALYSEFSSIARIGAALYQC